MTLAPAAPPPTDQAALRARARERAEELRRERVRLGEENIFFFARYYFPEFFSNPSPQFHADLIALARELELPADARGGRSGVVIAAPRGHAKSTILTFLLVLWWICYRKKRFVVIVSETASMAESFTGDIRTELEENERLREDFGDLCGDRVLGRPLKWTAGDFTAAWKDAAGRPTFRTRVLARSTGSQFRGLRKGANRPDAIICDDLENDEHVRTPEMRAKIWQWFTKAVIPALDPERGAILVVGTILHFDSLLMRLLKLAQSEGTYRWRIFKAIQPDGTVLWPARFSKAYLDRRRREMGSLAFNSEYMNEPIDEEARLYRHTWIKWYYGTELAYEEKRRRWLWRGEELDIYVGVDPAISESETADYFALTVVGLARKSKAIVLLYAFADRMDFPSQVQEIIRLDATWQPKRIGIERNAYQRALPQQLLRESATLPIKQLDNQGQKYTRILAASVPFENGVVYMRAAAEGEPGDTTEDPKLRVHQNLAAIYTQMMQYPMSANDDLLDSMENSFQIARLRGRAFDEDSWF